MGHGADRRDRLTGPRAAVRPRPGLTPRETDGLTVPVNRAINREIARILLISGRTAAVHISRISAKIWDG